MAHKKRGGGGDHDEGGGGHGDRPWVYFMIDSFFLVTQFFVLTFKVKAADDLILPHKLPPGGGAGRPTDVLPTPKTQVQITVNRDTAESAPWYKINGGELLDQKTLSDKLAETVEGKNPDTYSVRVSYEGSVYFKDVMPIFNTCLKLKIKECGLQISRDKVRN